MKVSLITYHDEDNYGAILQSYATYKMLNELGYDAEIIDFRMRHIQPLFNRLVFAIRRIRHNVFRKKWLNKRTRVYNSVAELRKDPPLSDCYLVGSDQTWNPCISKDNALAYFLDFGPETIRRVSYAASFGNDKWEDSIYAPTSVVRNILCKYHKVLVREDKAVDICKEVFNVDAQQVLDPVLLFSSYPELTGKYTIEKGKMIVYKLINNEDFYMKSALIADSLGMHRLSLGSVRRIKGAKCPYPESVDKWVKQIATSELVFTDSFHGTIVSLLYHRPFVIYVGDPNRVGRLSSILKVVGLEDRVCSPKDSLNILLETAKRKIDWSMVDRTINDLRLISIQKLKDALS